MSLSSIEPLLPQRRNGFWVWADRWQDLEVRFVGAGPAWDRKSLLSELSEASCLGLAWAEQVHGKQVLSVQTAGCCGPADGLWSRERSLAVSVVTADCVPILLGGNGVVAAIHAGWRGIEADIVGELLGQLSVTAPEVSAWIGPAIGPCCYEVGEDVAARVQASSSPAVAVPGTQGRPHLDLVAAARLQLERRGVKQVRVVAACTRCDGDRLASYRRDGRGGGRNIALAWLL